MGDRSLQALMVVDYRSRSLKHLGLGGDALRQLVSAKLLPGLSFLNLALPPNSLETVSDRRCLAQFHHSFMAPDC